MAILAGCPIGEESWPEVNTEAASALEEARGRVNAKTEEHRRGVYFTVRSGFSHGGGQKAPVKMANSRWNQRIADDLSKMKSFRRISGFANGRRSSSSGFFTTE